MFCVFFYLHFLLSKVAVKHHLVLKYHLHKPCRLLKWIVPFSRPQVNALRSEFCFAGCQDGGHALKYFLLCLLIYFVYEGACGGQRRTCGSQAWQKVH